jgi:hypothetical protein
MSRGFHAAYQHAPQSLTPEEPDLSGLDCARGTILETRTLSCQMLEVVDTESGVY